MAWWSITAILSGKKGGGQAQMSRNPGAARPRQWRIDSAYARRRDGPKRTEQAYRILIDGGEENPEKTKRRSG
ncbi:MAG: hypothetical protein AVDCRST_MAG37-3340 [uncultured Rubrobacteraceae bacterium]|uniref:Uncharacterized protein n=1 Tax=uncultured Rubrobacteraceae bacterium TaxID=349277 RepID=A0A6J4R3T6_9ACTN|nr:MAG: hypothetical protein AVDCRST_MAG37-3340 [uncultured Rubrobacteraceae bacterium]